MSNFIDDNLNQSVFLNINYLDVLGENTFEFCLYKLLTETLDLEEFENRYKNIKDRPTDITSRYQVINPDTKKVVYRKRVVFENNAGEAFDRISKSDMSNFK